MTANSRINRRGAPYILLLGGICADVQGASTVQISGVVRGRGMTLPTASAVCRANAGGRTAAADLQGKVSLTLDNVRDSNIYCTFSAPGYAPYDLTGVPNRGQVTFATIELVPLLTLSAGPLNVLRSADRKYTVLDTLIHNESGKAIQVTELHLNGTARAQTTCLDPRPSIIYRVKDNLRVSRNNMVADDAGATIESPNSNEKNAGYWKDDAEVNVSGSIERQGCNQARITLTFPYSFSIDKGEAPKIRVAVPQVLHEYAQTGPQSLDLSHWERLDIVFVLGDGSYVSAPLK